MKSPLRSIMHVILFGLAAIVTLIALGAAVISYTGRKDWSRTQAALTARGEKLTLVELAPPPIPDEDNVFAAPIWKEVFERNPDVPPDSLELEVFRSKVPEQMLVKVEAACVGIPVKFEGESRPSQTLFSSTLLLSRVLKAAQDAEKQEKSALLLLESTQPATPALQKLHEALQRANARAPIDYSKHMFAGVEHISYILTLSRTLAARAQAHLILGESGRAELAVLDLLRLAYALRAEPLLLCQLVRVSCVSLAISVLDTGIKSHSWSAAQLERISAALPHENQFGYLQMALRGERGAFNLAIPLMRSDPASAMGRTDQSMGLWKSILFRTLGPIFTPADQSFYNNLLQEWIDALEVAMTEGIRPGDVNDDWMDPSPFWQMRHFWTSLSAPSVSAAILKFARSQADLSQARVACALERYRIQHQQYPLRWMTWFPISCQKFRRTSSRVTRFVTGATVTTNSRSGQSAGTVRTKEASPASGAATPETGSGERYRARDQSRIDSQPRA